MQHVIYEARRSLAAGHTAGTSYTLDLRLRDKDRKRDVERKTHTAIGGAVYSTYYRGDTVWSLVTMPLAGDDAKQMREFLDSVEDGQLFSFDPFHWAAGVADLRAVVIHSDGYTEDRYVQRGSDDEDFFVFKFSVVEQP